MKKIKISRMLGKTLSKKIIIKAVHSNVQILYYLLTTYRSYLSIYLCTLEDITRDPYRFDITSNR